MAYTKQRATWVDYPDQSTPIRAQDMTGIENGIQAAASTADSAQSAASAAQSTANGAAQKSANLSDLANAATARTNLGLGGAATLSVGTTAGTVAAGDDSRFTKVNGVAVSGTPTSGQTIVATSGTAASWQTPGGGTPPFVPLAVYSGKYTTSGDGSVASQSVDLSQYSLFVPYVAATSQALTAIAVEVTTAVAASTVGIGVFGHDSTTGWPTTRLVDLGTIDSSTTGVKEATAAVSQTAGTVYWVGFWFSNNSAQIRGNSLSAAQHVPSASSNRFTGALQQQTTTASLPTTPTGLTTKDRNIWFALKG